MRNCHYALDIAYFGEDRRLINVVSIDPYPDPAVDPGESAPGGRAPSEEPAQFVLEMHKGWFHKRGLTNDAGKPVREIVLEVPGVSRLVNESD
jgi:uncharacterized membrane protein (UPF0127 family)